MAMDARKHSCMHHCRVGAGLQLNCISSQASGQAGDGAKGSICALPRNATGPSDCNTPLWCKPSDVPPLHGSGYGSCTDETYVPPAMPVAVAQPQAAALAPASPLDGFEVAERTTRAGATCRLPLIYK